MEISVDEASSALVVLVSKRMRMKGEEEGEVGMKELEELMAMEGEVESTMQEKRGVIRS